MKKFRDRSSSNSDHIELSKTEARQGETGHKLRYVLGFGLSLTVVAFIIVGLVYFT